VTQEQERAEAAVRFLADTAMEYGVSRAEVVKAEAMLRHIKALAMKSSGENSAAAQEREAYASGTYKLAIDDLFDATKIAEVLKAKREAAIARIDYWRSVNSNQRAAERGFGSAR
jgi:hypothetical protein